MRAIELETRVLAAVDQIKAGGSVESDFIECKREWPEDKKARQLAGSLNRAGGDPVIYIIGIDEKSGKIFEVGGTEVSNWWTQLASKFDQAPPEMIRHMSVAVGDEGETVVAAAFASDRAPYVIKTGLQDPNLEIPMREGTRTRTARRDELLRLLIPTVRLPEVVLLDISLQGQHYSQGSTSAETLKCEGQLRIYVEHNGDGLVTLPAHGMRGRVTIHDQVFAMDVTPPAETVTIPTGTQNFGMQRPSSGVSLTKPGAIPLHLEVKGLSASDKLLLVATEEMKVEVVLEVLHSVRPLKIEGTLSRSRPSNMHKPMDDVFGATRTPGSWTYQHVGQSFDD